MSKSNRSLCGEVELVRQVHTLVVRSAQQVVYELQVREEVEGVRQEVREVKGESKVEESRSLHERMWMRWMTNTCARCDTVLSNQKKRDNAHSHSGVRVVNVEVSDNGHVVIGVRIVQCHHAIMANSEFSTFGPNFNLVPISTCCQAV